MFIYGLFHFCWGLGGAGFDGFLFAAGCRVHATSRIAQRHRHFVCRTRISNSIATHLVRLVLPCCPFLTIASDR